MRMLKEILWAMRISWKSKRDPFFALKITRAILRDNKRMYGKWLPHKRG